MAADPADGAPQLSAEELLAAARFEHRIGPCQVFSQRFELRTTDVGLAALLRELYEATLVEPAEDGRRDGTVEQRVDTEPGEAVTRYRLLPPDGQHPGVVARDDEVLVTSPRPATLLGRLVWAINRQVIDGTTDRLLFHAAAAEVEGVGVLLPADMEAGKTTLVAGLLDRGAGYLTDEAAAVTGDDRSVTGFAKPLSVDRGSWEVLAHLRPDPGADLAPYLATQWQLSAARVGRVVRDVPLGVIVFRRFEAGAPTRLQPLGPADAVQRAVTCTFVTGTDHLPLARLRELAEIVEHVPAYELVGGDLDAACDAVLKIVADLPGADGPTGEAHDPARGGVAG